MFDGHFNDRLAQADATDTAAAVRNRDPLALLAMLERRLDRSDERLSDQLRALEGRIETLERDMDSIRLQSATGRRGLELRLVELADRLSGVERRRT